MLVGQIPETVFRSGVGIPVDYSPAETYFIAFFEDGWTGEFRPVGIGMSKGVM